MAFNYQISKAKFNTDTLQSLFHHIFISLFPNLYRFYLISTCPDLSFFFMNHKTHVFLNPVENAKHFNTSFLLDDVEKAGCIFFQVSAKDLLSLVLHFPIFSLSSDVFRLALAKRKVWWITISPVPIHRG